jgi:hypothetical protein
MKPHGISGRHCTYLNNLLEQLALALADEGHGRAAFPGACRPPDAVDVLRQVVRHREVDNNLLAKG